MNNESMSGQWTSQECYDPLWLRYRPHLFHLFSYCLLPTPVGCTFYCSVTHTRTGLSGFPQLLLFSLISYWDPYPSILWLYISIAL